MPETAACRPSSTLHQPQPTLSHASANASCHRSPFNDQINNSKLWGPLYDGRSIVSQIHEQHLAGATLEECQAALQRVAPAEEAAKLINTWA